MQTRSTNPKDGQGVQKVPFRFTPPSALIELGRAMRDGTRPRNGLPEGYGPFNWRDSKVDTAIYYEAALRHLFNWFEGQQRDPVSKAHELGHVMACCAIIIDAETSGALIDSRPVPNGWVVDQLGKFDEYAPDWTKAKGTKK